MPTSLIKQNWFNNLYVLTIYRLLLVMFLYMLTRIIFVVVNYDLFSGITASHFFTLLQSGIKFDLSAVMYINSLYIVCQVIPFLFRYNITYQKVLKWLFCITNAVALFANCADFAYFRFTFRRTTLASLTQFTNDITNTGLILKFAADYWWVLLIWGILLAILIAAYGKTNIKRPAVKNKIQYHVSTVMLMLLCVMVMVVGMRGNINDFPIAMNNATNKIKNPIEAGIVLNTPFCIIRAANQRSIDTYNFYTDDELTKIYSPVHTPANQNFIKINVVVIILEGFGKENIGFFNKHINNYDGYTPFLDSLLSEGLTFTRSFANGLCSNDGLSSVLSSMPALLPSPYVATIYGNNKIQGIATLLAENGYDCSFFHGAPNGSMRFLEFTKMAGFQNYYGQESYNNNSDYDGHWGIWDEPFFQYMANTLDNKKEPFFASMFTLTSHHPFRIPEKHNEIFLGGSLPIHKTISYTDYALRRFFETASAMPWFKNTLFVITADHTNGAIYDEYKSSVGRFSVPILFYKPNGGLKRVDSARVVQHIDIMPSILGYLNYSKPYFAYGNDIFSTEATESFAVNRFDDTFMFFKNEYVLLETNNSPNALYNYEQDPLLVNDLKNKNIDLTNDIDYIYKAFIQQYNNRIVNNKTVLQ